MGAGMNRLAGVSRLGSRSVLIVALVAALIGGVASYSVSALTSTATTEVRISAQRLEGGLIQFALQQRQPDGGWGERQLPSLNLLRAQGQLNRWANSSAIEVEVDTGLPLYVNTTEPTRSVTVDQYIALCADDESLLGEAAQALTELGEQSAAAGDGDESLTWGGLLVVLDLGITAWRSIEPPEALAEFHRGQLSSVTLMAQYAFAQDHEAAVDLWELLGIGFIVAAISQEAEANLDPGLRERLVESGCIQAADGGLDE